MSRDELIVVVRRQAGQLVAQERQITAQAGRSASWRRRTKRWRGSWPSLSTCCRGTRGTPRTRRRDDDPGKPTPSEKKDRGRVGPKRKRGKQPGAPGSHLRWIENPDERRDRFPQGRCDCGDDLGAACDLGIVDRYQQHEIPQVSVKVTQYDQHQVECGCEKVHTAARPEGARSGPVGYGPNLAAFAVYLMVVHFIPTHRVVALLESLTGTAPSVGFVHGMINCVVGLLTEAHQRIRTLIILAYAVCCDETPLRVGPNKAPAGKKKAERYLLVAVTEAYTHYLIGDRSMDTFTAFVVKDLTNSVIVHDHYQNYDSAKPGTLVHQLCCAHLLRDLDDAAQVYPDAVWPTQIADALRGLIYQANLVREQGLPAIAADIRDALLTRLRNGILVGLSDTTSHGTQPGERKARLLLKVLLDRPDDVYASSTTSRCPPPTKPNATCDPARSSRRSPGG